MEQKKERKNRILYKKQEGSLDFSILLVVTVLCAFGLVMVFSASYYYALHTKGCNYDGYYYLKRQMAYMALAYPLMLVLSKVNYRYIQNLGGAALVISLGLLVAVLAFGKELNGGKRWLELAGVSVQPSEVAKFGLIFYMCGYMSRHRGEMRSFTKGLAPMLLVMGMVCGLIMLQPNMSMAVIVAGIGGILLYLGGIDVRYFLGLAIAGAVLFVILAVAQPYRLARITSFRDPWKDPQGSGYQLIQALYAIGSGGWFGKGLGNSYQKLLYMTYGESDFIFAILCEELGFVGAVVVILLFILLIVRGYYIAMHARDRFGALLAAGISTHFALQTFLNIGVVTNFLPATGISLPFFSYGGTALLMQLFEAGIVLAVSRQNDNKLL